MKICFFPPIILSAFAAAVAFGATTISADAQMLLLNLGQTAVSAAQATNAPYNTGLSSTSSWNTVGASSPVTGLSYSNGAAATGVSLNLGVATGMTASNFRGGGTNLSFSTQTNLGSRAGTTYASSTVYATTSSPATDFIFAATTDSSISSTGLGLSISGLTPGTYTLYLNGFITGNGMTNSQEFFAMATAGVPASAIIYASLTPANGWVTATESNNTASQAGGYQLGGNYNSLTVTTTASNSNITLITDGTGTDSRAALNLLEVVPAVPEPSTLASLSLLAAVGWFVIQRRRCAGAE